MNADKLTSVVFVILGSLKSESMKLLEYLSQPNHVVIVFIFHAALYIYMSKTEQVCVRYLIGALKSVYQFSFHIDFAQYIKFYI